MNKYLLKTSEALLGDLRVGAGDCRCGRGGVLRWEGTGEFTLVNNLGTEIS